MHPKEMKKQKTGTGRLASICLPGSEILMGIDFTKNQRLCQLLADDSYYPVLMYPGEDAWTADRPGLKETVGNRKLLVIIIDSTWFCSKKMIRLSTNLHGLPKFSFGKNYRSIFTFKKEPKEYCISTIESCYYLIKELQESGMEKADVNPEPLMNIFKHMILFQLERQNQRIENGEPSTHAYDHKYTETVEIPEFLKDLNK